MHVAYLIQQFPPEVGAGAARAIELARHWQRRGIEVTIVTAMPTRRLPGRNGNGLPQEYRGHLFLQEEYEGIRVLRSWVSTQTASAASTLANNLSFMVSATLHALARLRRVSVLVASSPPFLPHLAGRLLARSLSAPLVLEVRDLWPDYLVEMGMLRPGAFGARALFATEARLLKGAHGVVVVTESFRRRVIAKGVNPDRVVVISNGVDLEFYPPTSAHQNGNGNHEFTVGYLGTFGAGQALSNVLDSAAILEREGAPVRFELVGDGPDHRNVLAHAQTTGVRHVHFRPPIPRTETPEFYRHCDVCLVPLAPISVFQETMPSKIFEVLACGRPVIASLGGEGKRLVEASKAGYVTAPGDARALADAIRAMMQLPAQERAALGRSGRLFVERHYNREKLADEYLAFLDRITLAPGVRSALAS